MKRRFDVLFIFFLCFIIFSSNSFAYNDNFKVETKNLLDKVSIIKTDSNSIKSYRGGGGIFIVSLTPVLRLFGHVCLEIDCDSDLNAEISQENMNKWDPVAEIIIKPDIDIEIKEYKITLNASYYFFGLEKFLIKKQTTILKVNITGWEYSNPTDYIVIKRDNFIRWLDEKLLFVDDFSEMDFFSYIHRQTLVVTHWTFLSEEWDMKVSCHMTIEPYNWSKLSLRKRCFARPFLYLKQDYDGNIHVISEKEFLGY